MIYTKENQEKGAELMRTLVEKAWESAAFKDQLVKNPVATIQEFANNSFTMPENKKLVVEDQTNESVIYFNIPAKPNYSEMELTDEQLELISGGEFVVGAAIGLGFAAVALFGAGLAIGQAMN
jgi:hypothetical protein